MRPISVAFVDHHPVLLAGLRSLFANVAGLEVVATGATAADAVQIAAETSPDILMMDLSRPDNAFEAVRQISVQRRKHAGCGVRGLTKRRTCGNGARCRRERLHPQVRQRQRTSPGRAWVDLAKII